MKKADIATIVLIAVLTTAVAYFIGNAILGNPDEATARIEYMTKISAEIAQPDPEVFNRNAINPTIDVYIGSDNETQVCTPGENGVTECE